MLRKLMIRWRSFKVRWLQGNRLKKPINNNILYDVYIDNPAYMSYNTITYYKSGKELKRTFTDRSKDER